MREKGLKVEKVNENDWTPERLRALDVAVAEARRWTRIDGLRPDPEALDYVWLGWRKPDGMASALPPVSLGCPDTFELMEEAKIDALAPSLDDGEWLGCYPEAMIGPGSEDIRRAPTPAIAICLAYLAAKGKPFNG